MLTHKDLKARTLERADVKAEYDRLDEDFVLFDEFLDAFLEEAVEANKCYCGGGGKEDKLDVVVELGRHSDDPDARLNRITAWLDARPDVEGLRLGRRGL